MSHDHASQPLSDTLNTYHVVPMEEQHIPRPKELWETRFGDPEHADAWLDDARVGADTTTQGFVAVNGGTVWGFGIATSSTDAEWLRDYFQPVEIDPTGKTGILHLLVVDADHEGMGIGTDLFRQRCQWLAGVAGVDAIYGVSWHREDHRDSRVLFEKFDFEAVESMDDYYAQDPVSSTCPDCEGGCECGATVYRYEVQG